MKKIFLSAAMFVSSIHVFAQDFPDLSASYYIWKPQGSTVSSEIKDGKKVSISDENGILKMRYELSGMQGGGTLTPQWYSDKTCRDQQVLTSVRMCTSGPTSYGWGGQVLEIEEGILVIGEMDYNLAGSGECTNMKIKGIGAILLRDESRKKTLSPAIIKAKCNDLLSQICQVMKEKSPQKKDLRGLANISAGGAPDFSGSKKLDGTYYTYRNPNGIGDLIYGDCKTAEIKDLGDHIEINSKFMGIKKVNVVFNSSAEFVAIEKASGHRILLNDASTTQYKIDYMRMIEIEDGLIVLARDINMDFNYESNCSPNADMICYVFFKDKDKCSNIALGEIKTKFKKVVSEMCAAYQKTLPPPASSKPVFLPEQKNKETALEKPAFTAICAYAKNMGWKETLIGSYIVSEEWMPVTKKELVNNSYIDVVKARQKYCIVFFKTDRGLYKSQGIAIAQDAAAGDYSGKNFNKDVYCSGVLTGLPGSGWEIQMVKEEVALKYKK